MLRSIRKRFKDASIKRRRGKLIKSLLPSAKIALLSGDRFIVNSSVFEDREHIQNFIVLLSSEIGCSVRASHSNGTLVIYPDDNMDNTSLTIGNIT